MKCAVGDGAAVAVPEKKEHKKNVLENVGHDYDDDDEDFVSCRGVRVIVNVLKLMFCVVFVTFLSNNLTTRHTKQQTQ